MSDIMVVDTFGTNELHGLYMDRYSHVSFYGVEPARSYSEVDKYHGHGGWCGSDVVSQSKDSTNLLFVRMFGGDGKVGDFRDVPGSGKSWWFELLKSERPNKVNMSWGAVSGSQSTDDYYSRVYSKLWVNNLIDIVEDVQCDIFFAAGNSGTSATEWPQRALVGAHPKIHIIGACDKDGRPATFSSSAKKRLRYADVMYLGEGSASLDGNNGKVVVWNGTSSSCPHAVGDANARQIGGQVLKDYWRKHTLDDSNMDGYADGVAPNFVGFIKGGGFHPKAGVGCAELSRQENMKKTKLGLRSTISDDYGTSMAITPMYHDFDRIEY